MTMDDQNITRYTSLVRAIARRYYRAGRMVDPALWTPDAIDQLGHIGVWNALRKYDSNGLHRNYAENTIVAFGIKAEIRKALRLANHGVDVPEEDETPDVADQPTIVLTPKWINSHEITRPLLVVPLEYHAETPDPAPSVEEQVIAAVDGMQLSTALESALLLLTETQRTIIARRYLDGNESPWTYEELGQALGCNKSTAWRNERKAMETLRKHLSTTRDGELQLIRLDERRVARTKRRAAA